MLLGKLLSSKKGFNDITIIAGILSIFLLTAVALPVINADIEIDSATYNEDGYTDNIVDSAESVNSLSAFNIIINVMKLAFWDIGNDLNLPWYLDMFFTLLTIILILTVARNIWVGGGG